MNTPPQGTAQRSASLLCPKKWISVGSAFLLALLCVHSCRAGGLASGSACTSASQCSFQVCELGFRPDGSAPTLDGAIVGTCAFRCESSADCSAGLICGRADFRGIDPDSGMRAGPDFEIIRTCRPPAATRCTDDTQCSGALRCLRSSFGDGVCAAPCTQRQQCTETFVCLQDEANFACGNPGLCAPKCDDRRECPAGWRCEVPFSNAVFGRCLPVESVDAGCDAPSPANDGTTPTTDDGGALDAADSAARGEPDAADADG